MSRLGTAVRLARTGTLGATLLRRLKVLVGVDLPVGDRYHDEKAGGYDAERVESPAWRWEDEVVAAHLARVPADLRVLDVPFGTGRFVPHYVRAGCRVVGVEVSADMLEGARMAHGEALDGFDLRLGDATALPLPDDDVDLAICFRFLPGIVTARQATAALRELARVTRGEALILLKHREDDAPRRWQDRWSRLGPRSPRQLRALLGATGWEVAEVIGMPGTNRAVYRCRPLPRG